MDKIWAIVLAAGESKRMGKQKMLLPFNGKTVIETVIQNIQPLLKKNILVILGSDHEEISKQINNLDVHISINHAYKKGMLSSIICGLNGLPENTKGVMVFLGDQPHIPSGVAQQVIDSWKNSNKGIAIPNVDGKRGHPTLIDIKYKTEITNLDPKKGLKQLMENHNDDILGVECTYPEILRDIDTPRDYQYEINKNINE